jgi:hypothetical protein
MTVPAGGVRAPPRCRAPATGQRSARRPRLRATTSRHTRNGRSAACSTTTGPIAAPGQAAARSPAAASSSTQAGRPAERSIRPVTGPGRALSRTEPARWARDTDPASDPCPAAGAMTTPSRSPALTAPGLSRKPVAEPRSPSQYERHSIPATRPLRPARRQHRQKCTRPSTPPRSARSQPAAAVPVRLRLGPPSEMADLSK